MSVKSPPSESATSGFSTSDPPATDPQLVEHFYGFKYCPHLMRNTTTCGVYHSGLGAGNRGKCDCPPRLVEMNGAVRDMFPKHLCPACEREYREIHPGFKARFTPRWILERKTKEKGKENIKGKGVGSNEGEERVEERTPLLRGENLSKEGNEIFISTDESV